MIFLTTGNSGQANMAIRLRFSLQASSNFGEMFFLTDSLPKKQVKKLRKSGLDVIQFSGDRLHDFQDIYGSETHPLGKIAKPAFVLSVIDNELAPVEDDEILCFLDPDIIVQSEINKLINHCAGNQVFFSKQYDNFLENKSLWTRLKRARAAGEITDTQFFSLNYEVNTGFFMGKKRLLKRVLEKWTSVMNHPVLREFKNKSQGHEVADAWHDQDYFRYWIRTDTSEELCVLNDRSVVHLCGDGYRNVDVRLGLKSGRISLNCFERNVHAFPVIVHFAGGSYSKYRAGIIYFEGFWAFYCKYINSKAALRAASRAFRRLMRN